MKEIGSLVINEVDKYRKICKKCDMMFNVKWYCDSCKKQPKLQQFKIWLYRLGERK